MKSVTFHPLQIFPRVSSYAKIYREEKRESKPREKNWGSTLFRKSPIFHFVTLLSAPAE